MANPPATAVRARRSPAPSASRTALVLAVLVAAGVAIPAALLTGAAAPPVAGLPDPGAVVRWGLPVVRAIHDVAAAATIGLLMMAATILPEGRRTSRRLTATRWASATGLVWVVTAIVGLVFSFADIVGSPPGSPGFFEQLQTFLFSLDTLRVGAISAGLAIVVAGGAAVVRTRAGMVWMFVLSVAAVLPLALAGHAAGSTDHDAAVNSLAAHLVATVLWVGGLLALVMLRPVLGKAMAVSVARYSTVAGWCFAVVALSGILNAWIRLGGLDGLASRYGVLIILKASALVLLGLAGWRQRRAIVGRLRDDPHARGAFARLATVEVLVMGFAIGVATALARSAPPVSAAPSGRADPVLALTGYAAPPPLTATGWITAWRVEWLFASMAVLAVGLYLAGVIRLHRRGDGWPVSRTIMWVIGWAVFLWSTNGAPGVYGRVLFSMHMTMHMTISMAVPILLVLSAPVTLALRTLPARTDRTLGPREMVLALVHSKYLGLLANPVVAATLFFVSLVVFYFSPLFELSLRTHTGHVLMTLHFLLVGYLFVWVLIGVDPGPKRWPPYLRLLVLFATISFHAFFGVALTTGSTLLAPDFFTNLHLSWGPGLLADQRKAGAVAWGLGEFPTLVLALLVTLAWLRDDTAEARRKDRQADRDDDAELKAYNAGLAALAAAGRRPAAQPAAHPAAQPAARQVGTSAGPREQGD